jgi:hypothetical protein
MEEFKRQEILRRARRALRGASEQQFERGLEALATKLGCSLQEACDQLCGFSEEFEEPLCPDPEVCGLD